MTPSLVRRLARHPSSSTDLPPGGPGRPSDSDCFVEAALSLTDLFHEVCDRLHSSPELQVRLHFETPHR